ncbi:MAG: hypothetical protein AAGK69_03690 [Pseudomonadota bacterium]
MTRQSQIALGLGCAAFAVLTLAVWIPLDTDTGLIETVRRRTAIGDAFAPTLAAGFILIGGLLTALSRAVPGGTEDAPRRALRFGAIMLAILIGGFLMALYAGPIAVALYNLGAAEPLEYRLLRGSFPWKYIGFVLGGTFAITGSIALAEGRLTRRAVLIGIGGVLGMIVLFDVPFDDLLLPPNGDY